ncbi:TetR/AcrR family transcriptional regulator [Nocardia mangyaensis]|uniref:TetR/AcrR family transcriptional regulator n=1 Tax=Nocardia mangyaensis TaxID=2213200 RepID=UPI0026761368|nr:TetR family transcriptional regulator [Nocardia mangyaensis]MDO3649243.1 TetR family transcriptional regulator [Nocardia mangyaensis]
MISQRDRVLDAAIEVLGTRGSRALTHRAVDEAAGLPTGSTSNYFRTRDALLCGLADRLEQRDHADWAALNREPAPATVDHLVDGLALFLTHTTTTDRVRTRARLALFGEAPTVPVLHDALHRAHHRLRDWAVDMAAQVGIAPGDTAILVDYLDGAVVHRLGGFERVTDPRPALARLVHALHRTGDSR